MSEIEFQLGGKQYKLSHAQIEEAMHYASPRALDKYFVEVNGKRYPPKQVLSTVLRLQPLSFTTVAANGILERLGFEVHNVRESVGQPRTESERLFESYLNASGYTNFEFEPMNSGPDFGLYLADRTTVFFEVKEFQPTEDDFRPGAGSYDPYEPIRLKIRSAMPRFRDLKNECCGLVLYNVGKPLVDLSWQFIYSAMLGNLSFSIPSFAEMRAGDDSVELGFEGGGEMLKNRFGKLEPQKTRIGAILVLEQYDIGRRRFNVEVQKEESELNRKLGLKEYLELEQKLRGTDANYFTRQLRVVVCQNPYAKPFPEELFRGPYDEIYGAREGHIVRKFAGDQILRLEEQIKLHSKIG
jgi:hypothetical protein